MTALASRTYIDDPTNNANAEIGLLALWDVLNEATEKPELDIASASTCNIGGMASTKLRITGTTTITSFGAVYRGPILIRIAAALTITHNATTLVCPGNANIVTAAGDVLMAWPKTTTSGTSDGWQVVVLAGQVGEYLSSVVLTPGISLANTIPANVTSLPLTAGDWDLSGEAVFLTATGTSITILQASLSQASATMDVNYSSSQASAAFIPGLLNIGKPLPVRRVSITSTTTFYLVASGAFSASSLNAFGRLQARRVK